MLKAGRWEVGAKRGQEPNEAGRENTGGAPSSAPSAISKLPEVMAAMEEEMSGAPLPSARNVTTACTDTPSHA